MVHICETQDHNSGHALNNVVVNRARLRNYESQAWVHSTNVRVTRVRKDLLVDY